MLRKKSSEGVSCRSERRECLWQFKCDVRQNSRLYKKKKLRGAPQRSKTRPRANRRGALSQIEEPDFFYSKEPFPFSKVGRLSQKQEQSGITRRAICLDVSSLVTCSLELCGNHEPNPELNPGFQKISFSSVVVTRHCIVSFAEIMGCFVRKRVTGTVHPSTGCRQK